MDISQDLLSQIYVQAYLQEKQRLTQLLNSGVCVGLPHNFVQPQQETAPPQPQPLMLLHHHQPDLLTHLSLPSFSQPYPPFQHQLMSNTFSDALLGQSAFTPSPIPLGLPPQLLSVESKFETPSPTPDLPSSQFASAPEPQREAPVPENTARELENTDSATTQPPQLYTDSGDFPYKASTTPDESLAGSRKTSEASTLSTSSVRTSGSESPSPGSLMDSGRFSPGLASQPKVQRSQRRAHIEFYRKLKLLHACKEKKLQCRTCGDEVPNTETGIRSHVYHHSTESLFACRLCQAGFKEQHSVFDHLILCRAKNGVSSQCEEGGRAAGSPSSGAIAAEDARLHIEDTRDMGKLTGILTSCFTKRGSKCRSGYTQMVDKLVEQMAATNVPAMECRMCNKEVPARKNSLVRHLSSHPIFRCKLCKFTCTEEEEQIRHCEDMHSTHDRGDLSIRGLLYSNCQAADVMTGLFKSCYLDHSPNNQVTPRPESPVDNS